MFIHIACIAVGADVDISYWLLNLKMLNKFLHPSFAVLCEWSFAAGLDLFTWITNLCRSCFSTFCIPVGPAFTVSEFDRVDGLGFAFDVFCVTLLFLASQSLLLLNCWHCQELLYYFFDWRWIKINPKRLRIKMYSFLKAFLVLMKLTTLAFIVFEWLKRIETNSTTLYDPRIRSKSVHPWTVFPLRKFHTEYFNLCFSEKTISQPCRYAISNAFQAVKGYTMYDMECCKCARMRFDCASGLVVMRSWAL